MTTVSSRPVESSPPPMAQVGPVAWLRKHLFNTWYNALLTVILGAILIAVGWGLVKWIFNIAPMGRDS